MDHSPTFWLLLVLLFFAVEAVFIAVEMAAISFNSVRLQYYVAKGHRRAIWLNYLLQKPSHLFGTSLLGINIALQFGSECARHFYESIGLNPDWAPVSQVILVIILAELAPLFAARRYAEHVAMLGVGLIYFTSKLMSPLLWVLDLVIRGLHTLIGGARGEVVLTVSRDELQRIVEEHEGEPTTEGDEFNAIVRNIFGLRNKSAGQAMTPMHLIKAVDSGSTVAHFRLVLKESGEEYLPIYHQSKKNIVGVATAREMVRAPDNRRARDQARPPWFITEETSVLEVLKQFRHNNQTVAVVLNETGQAQGILTLADILEEIFGASTPTPTQLRQLIDRTFPAETLVSTFNAQYDAHLEGSPSTTLEDLLHQHLGRHPAKGDTIRLGSFELRAEEATLLAVKTVSIRSIL